jgi:hypothetical protein
MFKLIFFLLLFSYEGFTQNLIYQKIKPVECQMWRGKRTEVVKITLHDFYSLLIPFNSLESFLVADHRGNAGFRGDGYRYVIFVFDPKVGGYVQAASSSITKGSLAIQDISFEDPKKEIRVRCRGR